MRRYRYRQRVVVKKNRCYLYKNKKGLKDADRVVRREEREYQYVQIEERKDSRMQTEC